MLCDALEKICPKCKETKLLTEFRKCSSSKDGLQYSCRACMCAVVARWKKANPEANKAHSSRHYQNRAEHIKARASAYQKANKDVIKATRARWIEKNPQSIKTIKSNWNKANPGYLAYSVSARRAAKSQRTPAWADKDSIKQIYIECSNRRAQGEDVVVDHIIPLRGKLVSGLHVAENLRIIPARENLLKNNKFDPEHVHS